MGICDFLTWLHQWYGGSIVCLPRELPWELVLYFELFFVLKKIGLN